MSCFPQEARDIFDREGKGELLSLLDEHHKELLGWRREFVEYADPETSSPKARARSNCLVLQQALLHRAERLLVSAGAMLVDQNSYGIALVVRGYCETVAVAGYFCYKFNSFRNGNIKFEDFEWEVADAILGARDTSFSKARPPPNILTCFDKADAFLDKHFFEKNQAMLRHIYDWLSEYAHPNFLSNFVSFDLDKQLHRMVMRHGVSVRQEDYQLFDYLNICSSLFSVLYARYSEYCDSGLLAE